MSNFPIRVWRKDDLDEVVRLSLALFPYAAPEEHRREIQTLLERDDARIFVIERQGGGLGGFVEAGTRSVADGCDSSPVGYIEAWYVDPDLRRSGLGRALLAAAEDWARQRGYTEMASDALIDNEVSHRAHRNAGYIEVDRVITYRKQL